MNEIISDIDNDLDVIFGEYRDTNAVQDFVASVRSVNFTGTLYIGYPVLTVDDERIEFDAVLISRNRGVIVFDLYSFDGGAQGTPQAIASAVAARQEQQFAALYNKLNSFGELRKNRKLIVDITTASIHPIADVFIQQDDAILLGPSRMDELPMVEQQDLLSDEQLEHLNAAIQRISNLRPKKKREDVVKSDSKGSMIKEIEKQIANLDLWQKRGSIEYVNGPQRIRGLAGSGKTVVLALKAAYLHVKRPDWHIVVTFNTRSLYQQFEALVNRFVFSQINDEPDWSKISIMHAWGGSERDGVYSSATSLLGIQYRDFGSAARQFGYDNAFDGACKEALTALGDREIETYDMLLVDEAQDLPASFFQLSYRLLKQPKRIVWAYDDLQNLGDVHMPSADELFGSGTNGEPLVVLRNMTDQPQQDIVLPRCYRNPPWTLATAHGLGFGVKRDQFAQIFDDLSLWKRLGYRPRVGTLEFDQQVDIERDPHSFPAFFGDLLAPTDSLVTATHSDQKAQYQWVVEQIRSLITEDELEHTDILIVLPNVRTSKSSGARILKALQEAGLQGHIPGQTSSRDAVYRKGSIAVTHIYRAKGNEAPAVFVVDAEFCEGTHGIKKRRNILFTAITRSRGWTYITGVGAGMEKITAEIDAIRRDNFSLKFHYPTREIARELAVTRDTALPEELGQDDFDDVRLALQKVKNASWEQLPLDLREQLKEVHGGGQ
tara:strand:+ start:3117 stop:5273 length:2157 start_codon:yes stop_codon:yes gene_type:complete